MSRPRVEPSSSLRLELSPSPAFGAAIVLLHAAAAACAAAVLPGTPGALLAAALLALGLAAAWSRALLRSRRSVRALLLGADELTLDLAGGESIRAQLAPRRHVSRLMVALPLRGSSRRTVLVTADMLGRDSFRLLRIWALWGRLPVAAKQLPG